MDEDDERMDDENFLIHNMLPNWVWWMVDVAIFAGIIAAVVSAYGFL